MTLKHAQHKNSNRKCRSTFYSCKLLQQLLSFNKKKKKKTTRFGKAVEKSAGCITFVKKERKCWIRSPLPTLMTDYGKGVLILLKRRPKSITILGVRDFSFNISGFCKAARRRVGLRLIPQSFSRSRSPHTGGAFLARENLWYPG